jgi:hypothetical protein
MNERLDELFEQCQGPSVSGHPDSGIHSERIVNIEKFAELILADCAKICGEMSNEYLANRKAATDFDEKNIYAEGQTAAEVIKYKINKHFGEQG